MNTIGPAWCFRVSASVIPVFVSVKYAAAKPERAGVPTISSAVATVRASPDGSRIRSREKPAISRTHPSGKERRPATVSASPERTSVAGTASFLPTVSRAAFAVTDGVPVSSSIAQAVPSDCGASVAVCANSNFFTKSKTSALFGMNVAPAAKEKTGRVPSTEAKSHQPSLSLGHVSSFAPSPTFTRPAPRQRPPFLKVYLAPDKVKACPFIVTSE